VGIEAGQLLLVLVVITGRATVARSSWEVPAPVRLAPAYLIGSLAAFWACERGAPVLRALTGWSAL
jgi:hypothetical protein